VAGLARARLDAFQETGVDPRAHRIEQCNLLRTQERADFMAQAKKHELLDAHESPHIWNTDERIGPYTPPQY
jgi:hypothetical protein